MKKPLTIEPFEKENLYHLVKFRNQNKLHNCIDRKKTSIADEQNKSHENLYVFNNGDFSGFLELYDIDHINQNAKFHLAMEEDEALARAVDLTIQYCFDSLALFKVSTLVPTTQQEYVTILRDKKFTSEVRWRQHLFLDGVYHSVQEFSLVTEDYEP